MGARAIVYSATDSFRAPFWRILLRFAHRRHMPSLEILIFTPLIILLAYLIFGMSGFGSTLIAVPLLTHVLPLKFVIPMVIILDCISSVTMGVKLREQVWKAEFIPMLPFLLLGLVAGAFVLMKLPPQWLILTLGCFVLIFAVNFLVNRKPLFRMPRWTVAPIGLLAGTTSSAFGVGGPIYVFYFTARGATAEQIRATVPAVFSFTSIARIIIFATIGLFNPQVLMATAVLLIPMALGLWCGHRLHGTLTREQALRVVGVLLLLSGVSLIARALA
ncbi:MAG: sulfite exporter TauE/SafE family protein [Betaproteobacteria bacterium]|nr:sulfite exporter TauE/SafE family protein [Betaproteobacteria bacterium]